VGGVTLLFGSLVCAGRGPLCGRYFGVSPGGRKYLGGKRGGRVEFADCSVALGTSSELVLEKVYFVVGILEPVADFKWWFYYVSL